MSRRPRRSASPPCISTLEARTARPTWEREVYAAPRREPSARLARRRSSTSAPAGAPGPSWNAGPTCLALDDDLKPDLASLTLSTQNFLTGPSINAPEAIIGTGAIMRDRGIVPGARALRLRDAQLCPRPPAQGPAARPPAVANLFFGNVAGMQATLPEVGLAVDDFPRARSGRAPGSATPS